MNFAAKKYENNERNSLAHPPPYRFWVLHSNFQQTLNRQKFSFPLSWESCGFLDGLCQQLILFLGPSFYFPQRSGVLVFSILGRAGRGRAPKNKVSMCEWFTFFTVCTICCVLAIAL